MLEHAFTACFCGASQCFVCVSNSCGFMACVCSANVCYVCVVHGRKVCVAARMCVVRELMRERGECLWFTACAWVTACECLDCVCVACMCGACMLRCVWCLYGAGMVWVCCVYVWCVCGAGVCGA